jgi:hypothetical protein
MKRPLILLLSLLTLGAISPALAQTSHYGLGSGPDSGIQYTPEETAPWQELEVEPPAFPRPENLREFYVSALASNTFLIDASTLAVGSDGVVRYVLVVRTAGGAENTSFEGIRCSDNTWKLYATGSRGGQWSKARISEWRPIENKPINRHHAALSRDFFCPNGNPILTPDEGRNALRLGKHPDTK